MFDLLTINISVELFGILICLTVIFCRNFLVGSRHQKVRSFFTLLVFSEALVLFVSAIIGIITATRPENSDTALKILSFLKYVFDYILIGLFTEYAGLYFNTSGSKLVRAVTWGIILLGIAALAYNLVVPIFYSVDGGKVVREQYFIVSQLPFILICLEDLIIFLVRRKEVSAFTFACFLIYVLIPVSAIAIQVTFVGLDLVNMALIVVLMFMFAVMQNQFVNEHIDQSRQLQESRMKLVMSQIKPHFLFNSLTSIAQLCDDDPALAKQTTISFANYLRGNLNSIDQTQAIPFSDELVHIRNYLQIECVRFGELLNVEYDIETEDFSVPALSVQPLIENAVKHGVGMKEDGGTVSLSVRKADGGVMIKVVDDGVGFDTAKISSSREHIGISNCKERLYSLCNAEMTIESAVGEGTSVTIFVPNKKEA